MYEILDFGAGRKLERIGGLVLDRPSPPAEGSEPRFPRAFWAKSAVGVFRRSEGLNGAWSWKIPEPGGNSGNPWIFETENFVLRLKPTEVGHLGVFPEQAENWRWIFERTRAALRTAEAFQVLNLFAYTGGSSLAAADAFRNAGISAEKKENFTVAHVDSAKNVVAWARENAAVSKLENVPIRWLAEDALKFVQREIRRGKRYHAVILDPPSYGHGTRGEVWQLERRLPELLAACAELTAGAPEFVLLTAHSPGLDAEGLRRFLRTAFPNLRKFEAGSMALSTSEGRKLPSGEFVRAVSS